MFQTTIGNRLRFCVMAVGSSLVLLLQMAIAPAAPQLPASEYYRIEEDWELIVKKPEAGRALPQVATEMSVTGDNTYVCNFDVNQRRVPSFENGGLQVQIWENQTNVAQKSYGTAVFATQDETITWTQYMERNGAALKFGISVGSSTTWGNLANAGLTVTKGDNALSLNSYNSEYSLANSVVTSGANLVKSLTLVQARKYRYSDLLGLPLVEIENIGRTAWEDSFLNQ